MLDGIFMFFSDKLFAAFIKDDRFMHILDGLLTSIQITLIAVVIGLVVGLFMAIFKIMGKKPLSTIADIYISIIRGTPVVVQLTIIYFVIFASVDLPLILIAAMAFGLNSGAYVAEIIRAGIQAVPKGQMEAARSLGMGYAKSMRFVIIPQAIKNILPALGNEFIVLLKETSVSGYIALDDLNRGGIIIKNITYDAFTPIISVAYIYWLMTSSLSAIQRSFERRLRQGD